MTISDLTRRFFAYWWVILITGIAFALVLFPWSNNTQYIGSMTVGINFNNPALIQADTSSQAYVNSFEGLSLYMEQRFTSVDIQNIISTESGINKSSLSAKSPFYDVLNQGAGFVNLSYTSNSKDESERFTKGVRIAYLQIIKEWNSSRQNEFRVDPMTDFTTSIVQVQKPVQFQLLPVIAGILLGLVMIMILPDPTSKSGTTKSDKKNSLAKEVKNLPIKDSAKTKPSL